MTALISNKKVRLNYEIVETYTAGIELFGYEVKSVRSSHGNLEGSYVSIKGNEVFLIGAKIPPFQAKNTPPSYNESRERKLLLTKKEILVLQRETKEKGLTIVPLSMYNKGRKLKVEVALVRGKKKYDKRESLKRRDIERDLGRRIK